MSQTTQPWRSEMARAVDHWREFSSAQYSATARESAGRRSLAPGGAGPTGGSPSNRTWSPGKPRHQRLASSTCPLHNNDHRRLGMYAPWTRMGVVELTFNWIAASTSSGKPRSRSSRPETQSRAAGSPGVAERCGTPAAPRQLPESMANRAHRVWCRLRSGPLSRGATLHRASVRTAIERPAARSIAATLLVGLLLAGLPSAGLANVETHDVGSLNEKLGKAKVIIDRLLESHGELFQERSNEQSLAEDMRVFFSLIRFSLDSR